MKNIKALLVCLLIMVSCNTESVNDCFQTAGHIIQQEVPVSDFTSIRVNKNVTLIVRQGSENKVVVETGKNLLNDVEVLVENGELILNDFNDCNFVREYGTTKIYVTASNITKIHNASQFDVHSEGVLAYPLLELLSTGGYETLRIAGFQMQVDTGKLSLLFNKYAFARISGKTNELSLTFTISDGRFEGADSIAQHVKVAHRSSNDMIVHPVQSLKGYIRSTGDVIAVNRPPVVEVEEAYTGRLIFRD